jgi:hypothetical protein
MVHGAWANPSVSHNNAHHYEPFGDPRLRAGRVNKTSVELRAHHNHAWLAAGDLDQASRQQA